jgi:hypothetical protein
MEGMAIRQVQRIWDLGGAHQGLQFRHQHPQTLAPEDEAAARRRRRATQPFFTLAVTTRMAGIGA